MRAGIVARARRHFHYFKDVSQLTELDVYRVCELFQVEDYSGATQHAIKKLLLPGQRGGGKDRAKDLREARDTLMRRLEMLIEDGLATPEPQAMPAPSVEPCRAAIEAGQQDLAELTELAQEGRRWRSFLDCSRERVRQALEAGQLPSLLDQLDVAIAEAEHRPGDWAPTRLSMGAICSSPTVGDLLAAFSIHEKAWASFSYKRDAALAIAAVNALPVLIATARSSLASPSTASEAATV